MSQQSQSQETKEKPAILKFSLSQWVAAGVSLVVLTLVLVCLALLHADHVVEQLELKTYDLRSQIQLGTEGKRPSDNIVILDFDDVSLSNYSDEFGVWPWARDVHAQMIEFLNRVGVKRLLYDIMFVSKRKGSELEDQMLADAFNKYNNVYLSMNLANDLKQSIDVGKDITPSGIEILKLLSVDVDSELSKASEESPLNLDRQDPDGVFFSNLTFNNYRSIMPALLGQNSRIGFINHTNDDDGVSRGNPLIFRFKYQGFIKTKALPIQQVDEHWEDANGHWVDEEGYLYEQSKALPIMPQTNGTFRSAQKELTNAEGYLLDDFNHLKYEREAHRNILYFPYLGLRAALELKYPHEKIHLKLTKDGHLKTHNYDIPLNANGDFLINWYTVNIGREALAKSVADTSKNIDLINERQDYLKGFIGSSGHTASDLAKARAELKDNNRILIQSQTEVQNARKQLQANYNSEPYLRIPAYKVINLMQKEEKGIPFTDNDLALQTFLKDKLLFVGATAVATYDLKNTSLYSTMPGVILQANLFDNLYQNTGHYIQRVPPYVNLIVTLFLCLLAAGCTLKMKSAIAGLLTTANIAIIYLLLNIIAFQKFYLWVNIAMPLTCLVITITITFMLKYFLSNKDYEKTYALATTDSMTGLYNHRFFQDHMRHSIEQSNRFKHKFSLLLIDIDFFKKFNDSHGHQAGDEVLRQVARKLKKNVRTVDVVARYGGEEMAIILDRANEEEALLVAQKIVRAIAEEAYPIAEGVSKHITISCGVSTYPTHGETPSQLIEFSDLGLYRAKENGRNQVGAQYDALPPDGGESHGKEDHHAA